MVAQHATVASGDESAAAAARDLRSKLQLATMYELFICWEHLIVITNSLLFWLFVVLFLNLLLIFIVWKHYGARIQVLITRKDEKQQILGIYPILVSHVSFIFQF